MKTIQKIKSNGRLVIPKVIRDTLEIGEGDVVEIDVKKIEKVEKPITVET